MTTNEQIRPPVPVLWAAVIAGVQCVFGLLFALILLIRQLTGRTDASIVYESGDAHTFVALDTAVFFIIIFGTVLLGAIFMSKARRWGRGPVVFQQLMLLLISYYVFTGGQLLAAIALALSAIIALVMLFSPSAVAWVTENY